MIFLLRPLAISSQLLAFRSRLTAIGYQLLAGFTGGKA